jgi:hypothetical protein
MFLLRPFKPRFYFGGAGARRGPRPPQTFNREIEMNLIQVQIVQRDPDRREEVPTQAEINEIAAKLATEVLPEDVEVGVWLVNFHPKHPFATSLKRDGWAEMPVEGTEWMLTAEMP